MHENVIERIKRIASSLGVTLSDIQAEEIRKVCPGGDEACIKREINALMSQQSDEDISFNEEEQESDMGIDYYSSGPRM